MATRHYGEFEILDYSGSKSSFSFSFGAITALSLPGFLADFGALRTALGGIIKGTIRREKWTGDETVLSNIPPLYDGAHRELKWLVWYETVSGDEEYSECTIATPDLDLLQSNRDEIDYSAPAAADFITAFENIARVPGNDVDPVVITRMFLIGVRN